MNISKTFLVTSALLLLLLIGFSIVSQGEVTTVKDPIPQAIDDEQTIHSKTFGHPFPIVHRDDIVCECSSYGMHWDVYVINILVYIILIIGISYFVSEIRKQKSSN